MTVSTEDGHVEYVCPGGHDGQACQFCDGGLFACSRCSSFEGATTTECPGVPMTREQSDAVYAGKLDYRDGAWADAGSGHSPHGRQRRRNERLGNPCRRCGATWPSGRGCTVDCYRADVGATS